MSCEQNDASLASGGAAPPNPGDDLRVDHYRIPKIPTFIRTNPALWFLQVERTLPTARITADLTKADVVISALDPDTVAILRDILLVDPPPQNQYDLIKNRIIGTYATSAESKLRMLLKGQVLDDGKLSLFLSRLRNLSEGQCNDNVIKSIFLEHIPNHHRGILIVTGLNDLNLLALTADELAENYSVTEHHVSAVSAKEATSDPFANLEAKVDDLAKRIDQINSRFKHMSRNLPRGRSFSRSRPNNYRDRSKRIHRPDFVTSIKNMETRPKIV